MLRLSEAEFRTLAGRERPGGRVQANRGMAAEEMVELQCQRYEAQGVAVIRKIATPWRVICHGELPGGKGRWTAFPARKSTVDFQGVWEGAAVAFDVKSVARGERLYLRDAILPPHQKEFMRRWTSAGGMAFLLTLFGEEWRLAPWCQVEAVLREGGAGLSRGDMAPVPGLDFLAVLGSRCCPAPDCPAVPVMGSCGRWRR